MLKNLLLFMLLLFGTSVFAQEGRPGLVRAYPIGGWDSLAARIHYPEIARRAGVQECAEVRFTVDSAGAITDSIYVSGCRPIFFDSIRAAVKSTRWHAETFEGKPDNSVVSFPIHFVIKGDPAIYGITVATTPAVVQAAY